MTNGDWLLKSKAVQVKDVCPYPDGSAQFNAWLEAEHEPRFKVGDIVAGVSRSPYTVNIIVGIDFGKRQYITSYFDESYDNVLNVKTRWIDSTIDFDDDGELHFIGKADEAMLKSNTKRQCMKVQIKVNARPYAGAPVPAFNAKCINESKLGSSDLRFKEYDAWLDVDAKEGGVDWLAQGTSSPNDDFDHEIVRAFVANGARPGTTIHLRFGRRGDGYKANYDLKT